MMPLLALLTPRTLFWVAIAALFMACGVQTVRLSSAKAALALEQASRALETATRERLAREQVERNAALERAHAAREQELTDAYQAELAKREAALAAASADGDSLRKQIDAYAALGPSGPTVSAVEFKRLQDRARTLGQLFGDADKLAERLAGAAEQRNAEVRLLKRQILSDRLACGGAS